MSNDMAAVIPTQLFPGYTFANNSITIPITDLPGLTAAEADPATGNAMEIVRTLLEKTQVQLTALTPETRPTRATLTKAQPSIALGVGIAPGTLRQSYTATFDLTPTGLEPAAE